jgi:hypothetical protein
MGPQDIEDDELIYIQVDPDYPKAWKEPEISAYLQGIIDRGGKLEVIIGDDIRIELGVENQGQKIVAGASE